ncbi:hypothetical protein [Rubellimicrobium roseum]|uniref:Uncharacterized protein n=1 Tax=Rubellimicrobium roseum TaxID=687525 RepID=A0A5C4N911_9RHOB|nr:hypothetical protein [Rubellimicrobium roseum]TNC62065.1 hypothetical protein FHG71_20515 [Rubellimicrobium roseum]
MDNAVHPHEAVVTRPLPKLQASPGWSAFFQSLSQSGQPLAQTTPDHIPPVALTPISRFATSA